MVKGQKTRCFVRNLLKNKLSKKEQQLTDAQWKTAKKITDLYMSFWFLTSIISVWRAFIGKKDGAIL